MFRGGPEPHKPSGNIKKEVNKYPSIVKRQIKENSIAASIKKKYDSEKD
jgi:hypothetical protein